MLKFVLKRFIIAVPLLFIISFIAFCIIQLAPGDYFDRMRLNPQMSSETINREEAKYHLDRPVPIQYYHWVKNLMHFDMGYSFTNNAPVSSVIVSRLLNTLLLSISALLFTWLLAIPLGIMSALHPNSHKDRFFSFLSFIGLSIPNFFLALLLLYLTTAYGLLPSGGMTSNNFDQMGTFEKMIDVLYHLIIPTIVIGTGAMASLQRITRGHMLEVLRSQYIMTARAKGLPENRVIYHHALRNAVNPLITLFGFQLSGLFSGAAMTEIICGWPGLGSLMLEATRSQDLYLVMGSIFMAGVMLIAGNLIADILLAWSDPRIRMLNSGGFSH
ncbi:MAG: ABC transporter permease [Chlamydiota bacterium]|nr:ABC transporter permease [Chlamydiota bacterium]